MQIQNIKWGTYPVCCTHNPYNYVTAKSPSDSTPLVFKLAISMPTNENIT